MRKTTKYLINITPNMSSTGEGGGLRYEYEEYCPRMVSINIRTFGLKNIIHRNVYLYISRNNFNGV
jgi:hypothetical protein